jgi:hypothetical protein
MPEPRATAQPSTEVHKDTDIAHITLEELKAKMNAAAAALKNNPPPPSKKSEKIAVRMRRLFPEATQAIADFEIRRRELANCLRTRKGNLYKDLVDYTKTNFEDVRIHIKLCRETLILAGAKMTAARERSLGLKEAKFRT